MEQGTTIEIHSEDCKTRSGSVYLAKSYKDAVEYEEYHGGIIFWEQSQYGTKTYRVFPTYFKEYVGFVYNMDND